VLGLKFSGFAKRTSSHLKRKSNNALSILRSVPPSEIQEGHGILTVCPSRPAFAIRLGPTNPWLIDIAKETLVFRRPGLSPGLRLLVPTLSLPNAPPLLTNMALLRWECSPTSPMQSIGALTGRRLYADLRRLYDNVYTHAVVFCVSPRSVRDCPRVSASH
jgi:hypothetical protein